MVTKDELTILQRAIIKAVQRGFLGEKNIRPQDVNIILDPPTVAIHVGTDDSNGDSELYYDPLYPIFERDWAVAFWGHELTGDIVWGTLPAWKYHQHVMLNFLQNGEMEEFYNYLTLFL